jgi:hypothetical protein
MVDKEGRNASEVFGLKMYEHGIGYRISRDPKVVMVSVVDMVPADYCVAELERILSSLRPVVRRSKRLRGD